jgi:ketosteroid isomerase-like protein
LKSGKLKFESYSASKFDVRVFGDTAVVIAVGNSKGSWNGETFEIKDRFTDVFTRRDGQWRLVSSHSSSLENEE